MSAQLGMFDLFDRPAPAAPVKAVPPLPDTRETCPPLGEWFDQVKAHALAVTEPGPEPEPRPTIEQERDRIRKAWRGDFEIVATDPKRFEFRKGDISNAYSCQSLAEDGAVRNPFRFRGGDWVSCGTSYMGAAIETQCYRIVPVEAFDGPHAPYSAHDWDSKRGDRALGSYHGMSATHGKRQVVLQGPPVVFVNGQPEQGGLL